MIRRIAVAIAALTAITAGALTVPAAASAGAQPGKPCWGKANCLVVVPAAQASVLGDSGQPDVHYHV